MVQCQSNEFLKSKNSTCIIVPGFSTAVSQPCTSCANAMYIELPFCDPNIPGFWTTEGRGWLVSGLYPLSLQGSLLVEGRCHQISKWWSICFTDISIWQAQLGWGFQHMISVASWEWNLDQWFSGGWFNSWNWQHLIQGTGSPVQIGSHPQWVGTYHCSQNSETKTFVYSTLSFYKQKTIYVCIKTYLTFW